MMGDDHNTNHAVPDSPRGEAMTLARELGGDIPCVRCRYSLRGLSVRGVCPECGAPVRATLLARVDPMASELAPITRPALVGWGLLAWSWGAVFAALCAWVLRLAAYFVPESELMYRVAPLAFGVMGGALISWTGAAALVSPQERLPRTHRLAALAGVVCYIPVVFTLWALHVGEDIWGPIGFGGSGAGQYMDRLLLGLGLIGIALGLRPNGRALTARSMVMRKGMVDRQTLFGLAGAVAMALLGDAIVQWLGYRPGADVWRVLGKLLVLCGSVLATLGLVGVAVDAWRIRGVIRQPPLTLAGLLEKPARGGS